MYRVAIVEDEDKCANSLKDCIDDYGKESGTTFSTTRFKNGYEFITDYINDFDVVFMDLDMPYMNGMQVAKELRKRDPMVCLVFVTRLAKYAIKGYEVSALDFILKPVNYDSFKVKMERVVRTVLSKEKQEVVFPVKGGLVKTDIALIKYVEVVGHKVIYHMVDGKKEGNTPLRDVESRLPKDKFRRCGRSYLVNLRNVSYVDSKHVYVGGEKLPLSRSRKEEFISALHEYVANTSKN
ncbi:MAG: response regulator transcription factor [Clostridia bacterium]|nr:response regulator transcription factor [Clostridia bacterium]